MSALRDVKPIRGGGRRGRSLTGTLASVRFAVGVVIVIALACGAGTIIPQGPDVPRYLAAHPEASSRMALLDALQLTRVYTSWWFVGLLSVLSASVATCSAKRFRTVLSSQGFVRRRAAGSMLTHVSILLILAGGIVRGVWGQRGYVEFREGELRTEFLTDLGPRPLPAGLRLRKFEVELDVRPGGNPVAASTGSLRVAWPERDVTVEVPARLHDPQVIPSGGPAGAGQDFRVEVLQYEPDFVIDPGTREVRSRSAEPRNPAVLVSIAGPGYMNHRWVFARYPEFTMKTGDAHGNRECPLDIVYELDPAAAAPPAAPIRAFRSHVDFLPAGADPVSRTVEVNGPASYGGYTFYQSGYRPEEPGWTSLQVVRDPGVPLVYAGFVLMILGLVIVFYLNPWLKPSRSAS